MELSRRTRWTIIIIIAVLAIIITAYIYLSESNNKKNMSIFLNNLKQVNEVALIMDTRGSDSLELNHNIMTCGIGIAQGNALAGKDTTIYGIEDSGCVISYPNDTHDANATIEKCENEIKQKMQIYIKPGNEDKTIFEEYKMIIYLTADYNETCSLQFE